MKPITIIKDEAYADDLLAQAQQKTLNIFLTDLKLPDYVEEILASLEQAGYEAYVVGGCVRDALMGRMPADWDVCTSALPGETAVCFAEQKTILTGMKHGTVTVLADGRPVEVTTYRIDGEYLDSRHPSKVEFTPSLEEDLQRRDFTMNAIAYCPSVGMVDVCGGRVDIAANMIRCVGDAEQRFREDALRILRGLRFAATMGFALDAETAAAVDSCRTLLRHISKERINQEFSKLVLGEYADEVINAYYKVLKICAPGIVRTALKGLPESLPVRLAVLFPSDTVQALRNLKFDRVTINMASAVSKLLERRNKPSVERGEMLRLLREAGREVTELYYAAADQRRPDSVRVFPFLEELLAENPCYLIEHLAISGKDLIEMGMKSGPAVGDALDNVLDLIIEGSLKNDRDELLRHIANTECKNEKGWKEQKNELQCKTNLGH
ncbi:CCA tRNA nucleotidyltransferase [Ihubacter sp. mB4P-1]|uniref:CCA tRNA nucleotidyltransferase n=1 Tax=Ihubacter sp. mB4P-1 TaxID=3242370 RepID=UPI001379EDF7